MAELTKYPKKYQCTVIQEEIAVHSIKELTDKLEKLGFNETSAINIKAEVFGLVKVPAECEA